jgi:4,5:9,10-diseco-3-hydroxy-5,9,17-trioxoandrosta-1(10),2-diene-4-oate hydrolase
MPHIRLRGGEVDGLSVHYVVEGHGPSTVLLLHGLGGFAESWRHNLGPLAERATVYALDLPGFGASAKPRVRYGLTFFTRAVQGFMETLGVGSASLVGHSLGAAVAVTCALVYPNRFERLALLGAVVPGFAYRMSWPYRLLAVRPLGEALSLLGCAPLYRAALARCFHAPVAEEVEFLVKWGQRRRTSFDARAAYLATLRGVRDDFMAQSADYRRALSTLDLPVLLVHGRQDPVVPPTHCADVCDGLPRAAVRWLDACGHFPQIERAPMVNAWLADFLAGRPAPR